MTDMAAAPDTLLKFVRCKCKLLLGIHVEPPMYALAAKMVSSVLLLVGTAEEKIVEMLRTLFLPCVSI